MKNMVRQLIAVTFGLCLSMFFSICSFASTGYPWFQVPNNVSHKISANFYWYDSSGNQYSASASVSDGNVVYLALPSNFTSTYSNQYAPRFNLYFNEVKSGYHGMTIYNSSVKFIDSDPGVSPSSLSICWATTGYGSNSKYSMSTNYTDTTSRVRLGSVTCFHPNGDGGTALSASDFPISFKVNAYIGEFNYSGIPDDGVYNATTINSNKANTAIELSAENSDDIDSLSERVTSVENSLDDLISSLIGSLEWLTRNVCNLYRSTTNSTWTDSQGGSHTYMSFSQRTYSIQNEKVIHSDTTVYCTFLWAFFNRISNLLDYLQLQFDVLWEWWYPLKSSTPQYWNVYNTDTDDTELVNPSTVTYYITWYLGQLFLMNNDNTPLGDLQDNVDDIKDQFQTVESQELAIIDSIDDSFSSFMPDLSQIGSFRALSWCSNYLQQIYVSLGAYGTVILIGLLLGVCMQFIGYFRYK